MHFAILIVGVLVSFQASATDLNDLKAKIEIFGPKKSKPAVKDTRDLQALRASIHKDAGRIREYLQDKKKVLSYSELQDAYEDLSRVEYDLKRKVRRKPLDRRQLSKEDEDRSKNELKQLMAHSIAYIETSIEGNARKLDEGDLRAAANGVNRVTDALERDARDHNGIIDGEENQPETHVEIHIPDILKQN